MSSDERTPPQTSAVHSPIVRVRTLDIRIGSHVWDFADRHRAEIDTSFEELKQGRSGIWNGRVLLLHRHALIDDIFRGEAFTTDFASFISWRTRGFPDPSVSNFFGMSALRSSDGAFLLGVMGAHTVNSGQIYFPAGTPDPSDIVGDHVDLEGSVLRELTEETGLTAADVDVEPGWMAVFVGQQIAFMKILNAADNARALRDRILSNIARQDQPELSDIHIAKGPSDFSSAMPDFITVFLTAMWTQ